MDKSNKIKFQSKSDISKKNILLRVDLNITSLNGKIIDNSKSFKNTTSQISKIMESIN